MAAAEGGAGDASGSAGGYDRKARCGLLLCLPSHPACGGVDDTMGVAERYWEELAAAAAESGGAPPDDHPVPRGTMLGAVVERLRDAVAAGGTGTASAHAAVAAWDDAVTTLSPEVDGHTEALLGLPDAPTADVVGVSSPGSGGSGAPPADFMARGVVAIADAAAQVATAFPDATVKLPVSAIVGVDVVAGARISSAPEDTVLSVAQTASLCACAAMAAFPFPAPYVHEATDATDTAPAGASWTDIRPWLGAQTAPWLNGGRERMFQVERAVRAYLAGLLSSFSQGVARGLRIRRGCLRRGDVDWAAVRCSIAVIRRGDDASRRRDLEAVVAFSNKDVGFGPGGTQEEMVFGARPMLLAAPLLVPTLQDGEACLLEGAHVAVRLEGYGRGVHLGSLVSAADASEAHPNALRVVAMDAAELDSPDSRPAEAAGFAVPDAAPVLLDRELRKATCGFALLRSRHDEAEASDSAPLVATGPWGCGAFGGDAAVKALVQVMAASVAGVTLVYDTFGDTGFLDRLERVANGMAERRVAVGDVFSALSEASSSLTGTGGGHDALDAIAARYLAE